jgi:hypothetical protein
MFIYKNVIHYLPYTTYLTLLSRHFKSFPHVYLHWTSECSINLFNNWHDYIFLTLMVPWIFFPIPRDWHGPQIRKILWDEKVWCLRTGPNQQGLRHTAKLWLWILPLLSSNSCRSPDAQCNVWLRIALWLLFHSILILFIWFLFNYTCAISFLTVQICTLLLLELIRRKCT